MVTPKQWFREPKIFFMASLDDGLRPVQIRCEEPFHFIYGYDLMLNTDMTVSEQLYLIGKAFLGMAKQAESGQTKYPEGESLPFAGNPQ